MPNSKEIKEATREPLEVRFGDVFKPVFPNSPLRIIVSVENNNSCGDCALYKTKEGAEFINITGEGSTALEYIQEIIDHWDIERVVKAARDGFKRAFPNNEDLWAEIEDMLKKDSKKDPVTLYPEK